MYNDFVKKQPKVSQAEFDKITIRGDDYCFRLRNKQHTLTTHDLVEIIIQYGKKEYKAIHYVGSYTGDSMNDAFTIDGQLLMSKEDLDAFTNSEELTGSWSLINGIELSIKNCATLITALSSNEIYKSHFADEYRGLLFKIVEKRIFDSGKVPETCTDEYLRQLLNLSDDELSKIDTDNITTLNGLVANINQRYVNNAHRIVRFDDNFIITPEEYPITYFRFLILSLLEAEIINVHVILNYHIAKHSDIHQFCNELKAHYRNLPDVLKKIDLKDTIWEWIEQSALHFSVSEPNESENERLHGRVMGVNERVTERLTRLSERVTDRVAEGVTRQFIAKEINAIDRIGWNYVFETERDYNAFLDLLADYFDNNTYIIPEKITRLKKGCQTRLGKALRPIHKKFNGGGLMDTKFFDILRNYNHFEGFSDDKMFAVITK